MNAPAARRSLRRARLGPVCFGRIAFMMAERFSLEMMSIPHGLPFGLRKKVLIDLLQDERLLRDHADVVFEKQL